MKKRIFFIVLFVVSIGGLAIVQWRYLNIGLNLAGVQFNRKVAEAGEDIRNGLVSRNQLTYLLASVLERDSTRFNTGLDHMTDASRRFLEEYLREKLIDNEIDADFRFSLMTRDSSYYLGSSQRLEERGALFTYPIEVQGYLPSRVGQRLILLLQFKDLNRYFLTQLNGLTLPSLLFLLGIFLAVLWGLRTYYWQEKTLTTTHEFVNNLTHELRTPVFTISLAAKILKEKAGQVAASAEVHGSPGKGQVDKAGSATTGESMVSLADSILQQTSRLSKHIDKVLELGSLEKGASSMNLEEINVLPLLEGICRQFEARAALERQPFQFELPDAPLLLRGSSFHLENAVNNLLDNARKYGDGKPILLSASREGDALAIEVRDQGKGIPEGEREKIFDKYYRIQEGDRQGVRGYGLGLSYVKTVIDRHKGRITVESRPNEGTVISLHLPLTSDAGETV